MGTHALTSAMPATGVRCYVHIMCCGNTNLNVSCNCCCCCSPCLLQLRLQIADLFFQWTYDRSQQLGIFLCLQCIASINNISARDVKRSSKIQSSIYTKCYILILQITNSVSDSESIFKIGKQLIKLLQKVWHHVFYSHTHIYSRFLHSHSLFRYSLLDL